MNPRPAARGAPGNLEQRRPDVSSGAGAAYAEGYRWFMSSAKREQWIWLLDFAEKMQKFTGTSFAFAGDRSGGIIICTILHVYAAAPVTIDTRIPLKKKREVKELFPRTRDVIQSLWP